MKPAAWCAFGFLAIGLGVSGCVTPHSGSVGPTTTVPKGNGSPWTILCLEIRGQHSRANVDTIAETLRHTRDIQPRWVSVLHDPDGFSRVYYGTYFRQTDPKTGKRPVPAELQRDRDLIRHLTGPGGESYFAGAKVVRLPLPDVGNPKWAIKNARGVYSLQIAAFEPTDDFWDIKSGAAEYCAWLRGKGYEAYYHHGPACSIVTVGSFDESAVIPAEKGLPRYSHAVLKMQEDELLRYNLVNGAIVRARSADPNDMPGSLSGVDSAPVDLQPVPSRLVPIPRGEGVGRGRS